MIRQSLLRLLLAAASIFLAVQLFRLVLIPGIEAVFHPSGFMTIAIRRSGILAFALLGYWLHVRHVEKRPAIELKLRPAGIGLAAVAGMAMISVTLIALFAAGVYEVVLFRGPRIELLGVASVILVAAMLEELVFRGVLFRILEDALGTTWALWLQAGIFAALHLANAESSPSELATTLVSGTLIGALWTLLFVATRNLWIVAAHHAAWNFTILLAGVPLSGLLNWRSMAPIESRYDGPQWLTGGVFGPEDSLITMVVVSLVVVALVVWTRRTGRYLPPPSLRAA